MIDPPIAHACTKIQVCKPHSSRDKCDEKGEFTLQKIYIGFCPHMEFHNIMHNDYLAHDYCVYEIFSLYLFSLLNYIILCYVTSENKGNPN